MTNGFSKHPMQPGSGSSSVGGFNYQQQLQQQQHAMPTGDEMSTEL
jgi:hypothetical protein